MPVAAKGRRSRRYIPNDDLAPIFHLVGRMRVVTVPHLHELVFKSHGDGRALRTTRERIQTLIAHKYLKAFSLPARPPIRFVYLGPASYARWPELQFLFVPSAQKAPPMPLSMYAWQRAALAVSFTQKGYRVGRDLSALTALRRNLIDRQLAKVEASTGRDRESGKIIVNRLRALPLLQPWVTYECSQCGHELPLGSPKQSRCLECGGDMTVQVVTQPIACAQCGMKSVQAFSMLHQQTKCNGTLRAVDYLPFDLAWRRHCGRYEATILLVDQPYRSVDAQLAELPLRLYGQPKLDIVLRPSDDGTTFDPQTGTYAVKGHRFRRFVRTLCEPSDNPNQRSFVDTANLLPEREFPDTHFCKLRAA